MTQPQARSPPLRRPRRPARSGTPRRRRRPDRLQPRLPPRGKACQPGFGPLQRHPGDPPRGAGGDPRSAVRQREVEPSTTHCREEFNLGRPPGAWWLPGGAVRRLPVRLSDSLSGLIARGVRVEQGAAGRHIRRRTRGGSRPRSRPGGQPTRPMSNQGVSFQMPLGVNFGRRWRSPNDLHRFRSASAVVRSDLTRPDNHARWGRSCHRACQPRGTSFGQRRECMSESGRQGGDPGRDRGPRADNLHHEERDDNVDGVGRLGAAGGRGIDGVPSLADRVSTPLMRLVHCDSGGRFVSRRDGTRRLRPLPGRGRGEPGRALARHPKPEVATFKGSRQAAATSRRRPVSTS